MRFVLIAIFKRGIISLGFYAKHVDRSRSQVCQIGRIIHHGQTLHHLAVNSVHFHCACFNSRNHEQSVSHIRFAAFVGNIINRRRIAGRHINDLTEIVIVIFMEYDSLNQFCRLFINAPYIILGIYSCCRIVVKVIRMRRVIYTATDATQYDCLILCCLSKSKGSIHCLPTSGLDHTCCQSKYCSLSPDSSGQFP